MDWQEKFNTKPIFKYLRKLDEKIAKCDNLIDLLELEQEKDSIKEFSVGILQRIKDGDEFAFNELIQLKDIRNFIYYYAYCIGKYHKFFYDEEIIVQEIMYQLFYHIKKNYRIYYQPNEISLLIVSMRGWIRQNVSKSLKRNFFPKRDEYLKTSNVEEDEDCFSDVFVEDYLDQSGLTERERKVFQLRFYDMYGYVEIGKIMGFSKDSAQRSYIKALEKIKKVIDETTLY